MKKSVKLLFMSMVVFSIVSCFPSDAAGAISATDLKTEGMVNPLGVDVAQPGFSWVLTSRVRGQKQTGYAILVASSEDNLAGNIGDIWSSGRVNSNEQTSIIYKGPTLQSDGRYYWKVQVWDKDNAASDWSEPAYWEMGLLNSSEWQGKWIGTTTEKPSPLFRKDFTLSKTVKKATAHVFGLGWYEMHLNGSKVGNRVLTPANCIYQYTTLYDSYDVTSYLKNGGNCVGLWLANGYGSAYSGWGWRWTSSKRAILQLNIEYTDGTASSVITDETWQASSGPITEAEMYNGETYDARLEKDGWDAYGYNASGWENVAVKSAPGGTMRSNMMPPVRVVKVLQPVSFSEISSGVYVYDLGQNFAGWVRVHVPAGTSEGTTIVLSHAEDAYSGGSLDARTNRNAAATDTYICKGGGSDVIYEPRFTYHGFRYVELRGYPGTPTLSTIEGCAIHADVDSVGHFSCSNDLFNRIHRNCQWGILNNKVSIPTDNPVRDERTPCMMDVNCYIEAAIHNFDMLQYFKNWHFIHPLENGTYFTGNHKEPQSAAGHVWGPWFLYQYYGDKRILETFYDKAKSAVDIAYSVSNTWPSCFGDWCPAYSNGNPYSEGEVVNTTLFYTMADIFSRWAGILGKTSDSAQYTSTANSIKTNFNNNFLSASNVYGSGNQVCYVLPFMGNMVPEDRKTAVFNNLVDNIMGSTNNGHLRTGIYGTSFLFDVLCDNGEPDVAYTVLNQRIYPSFGDQIYNYDATTTWEQWDFQSPMITHDHAMFAGMDRTFYTRFGGIQPMTPGYGTIRIKPYLPENLIHVNSSIKTVKGLVTSNWDRSDDAYSHRVIIPVNTTALVYVPGTDTNQVCESGIPVSQANGVQYQGIENSYIVYAVESGSYLFTYGLPSGTVKSPVWLTLHAFTIGLRQNSVRLRWNITGPADASSHVKIRIYTMQGRCIAEPINAVQKAGTYSVTCTGMGAGSYLATCWIGKERRLVKKFIMVY